MKLILKHTKKLIVLLLVLLIVIGSVVLAVAANHTEPPAARTAEAQTRDLYMTTGAIGTVQCASAETVLFNHAYSVDTVNVKAGTAVRQGTVLFRYDTAEIEEKISEFQEMLQSIESSEQLSQENTAAKNQMKQSFLQSALHQADTQYQNALIRLSDAKAALEASNAEYQAWLDVQAETDPETAPAPAAADKGEILQRQCARCEEILAESTANAKIWMNEKIKAEDAIQSYQNSEQYEESLKKYTKSASEHYKQQISELETVLAQAEVKAPCSGVVTDVFCLEGEPGRQFTPAIVIGRTDAFEAVLTVSAETRMKLRVNMPVWLTVSTAPEQTINGTVTEIRQTVQNDYEVRVSVDTDANNMMRSGVSCSAKIILEQSEQTLSVPYDAVMSGESGEYVWRMQYGNPVRQNVQTGLHCGYYTEIIDNGALKPQDEILLNPEDILGEKAS